MHSIDGMRKLQQSEKPQRGIRIPVKIAKPVVAAKQPKHIGLFKFVEPKQIATIAVTFLVTFVFSIATSRGLADYSNQQAAVPVASAQSAGARSENSSAGSSNAQTLIAVADHPEQIPGFDPAVLSHPGQVFLPKEKLNLPDPLQQRKEFLQQYLNAQHSPLADHVDAISEQSQWKLIIAIARAESSFCKRQVSNNCWGIGGAWNMKHYKNLDEGIADVNRILEDHYIQAGLDTTKEIEHKYVGYPSPTWEEAVNEELANLAKVQ